MIGRTLSHYRITTLIGHGGMGAVYRAVDTRLERTVAIKVLPEAVAADPDRRRRFVQEARAASALNHPNIATVHEIDAAGGVDFIVMECIDGEPLQRLVPPGGAPVDRVLDLGAQVASALTAAHAAGIVHRDIKPGNIVVTPDGRAKVVDFGLSKLIERTPAGGADETMTAGDATMAGAVLGTVGYAAPEQLEGRPTDARADVFDFGSVLYEALAGRRPFEGSSLASTIAANLQVAPPALSAVRPDVPAPLARLVERCLAKHPADRPTAAEVHAALARLLEERRARPAAVRARRQGIAGAAIAAAVTLAASGAWWGLREARARWARETALPEIVRLAQEGDYDAAFRLAREALRVAPHDPQLRQVWTNISFATPVAGQLPGARVAFKGYRALDRPWEPLAPAPDGERRVPLGLLRWRITQPGFEEVELAAGDWMTARLDRTGTRPAGMVRALGGPLTLAEQTVTLDDFWIDVYEVTNREFQAFVDQGGYRRRELWRHPFVREGRALSWEDAVARFRDATGRPGPAAWELGSYPAGEDDHPVRGVSWYEAAAYAEFAGKSLPTIYHWAKAAEFFLFSDVLALSNFDGKGPARVGQYQGLGAYGTYDLAGNVKEWVATPTGDRRYTMGGAWNEPSYLYREADPRPPFDRSPTLGFRCVRYLAPLADELTGPVDQVERDYAHETPVGDEMFAAFARQYAYDRTPLEARTEAVDEAPPYWRRETISIATAYGRERMPMFLFLPKGGRPPYQAVIYFPGGDAPSLRSSRDLWLLWVDFVIRSGRALLYPVYQGTYERGPYRFGGANRYRDLVIQWSQDVGRAVDYLETRVDIDADRIAYYGLSLGAEVGTVVTAVEPRFKAIVLAHGGLPVTRQPPEIDALNFAPRIKAPTLLVNGRDDFVFPLRTSQVPLFELLGTRRADRRHALIDGGHIPARVQDVIREILDWLDRYLGPVGTDGGPPPPA